MSLARKQHNITGYGLNQRPPNGFFAVGLDLMTCAGLAQAGQRVGKNLRRFFPARIVRGKKNEVAPPPRTPRHKRALRPITITAAAENRDYPARRGTSVGKVA